MFLSANLHAIFNSVSPVDRHVVSPYEIAESERSKCIGVELLATEHFMYAHLLLTILLALLFTTFIDFHRYLPDGIMEAFILSPSGNRKYTSYCSFGSELFDLEAFS